MVESTSRHPAQPNSTDSESKSICHQSESHASLPNCLPDCVEVSITFFSDKYPHDVFCPTGLNTSNCWQAVSYCSIHVGDLLTHQIWVNLLTLALKRFGGCEMCSTIPVPDSQVRTPSCFPKPKKSLELESQFLLQTLDCIIQLFVRLERHG